jgi:TPR repeat protein
MEDDGAALAEGLFWYAEKLMWGYEDTTKDPSEAFRFYKQAADLGLGDAFIRLGQLYEFGKGTDVDISNAVSDSVGKGTLFAARK